jgi:membrane protein implicated in regulation of membrane protease activity
MTDAGRVVAEIEHYWLGAGLPRQLVAEMTAELETHLAAVQAEGRTIDSVVGDRGAFAEEWAAASTGRSVASWRDVQSGRTSRERESRRDAVAYGVGAAALVGAAIAAGQGGIDVDNEVWRWLWTVFAIVMGVGEMFTVGFFLLPFAIGAGCAALLAWLEVGLVAQWLVFFGVTAISMAYLRRYIGRQDEGGQPRVGANRWIGSEGVVLEDIDPTTGAGMVRILNEEWRATSPGPIEHGARIVVTDVEGTRLSVERVES